MPGKVATINNLEGLSSQKVRSLREQFGKNIFQAELPRRFINIVWDIVKEPMFIILLIACLLYFILGETGEGLMMLAAMLIITAISLYQDVKSTNALQALKELTEPTIRVLRDGREVTIGTEELVPGDIIFLSEGMKIPADAMILQENDFSVNESIITGESLPVEKSISGEENKLFQGTTVNSGKCVAAVTATGTNTQLGKIGRMVSEYQPAPTALQGQINLFIRRLSIFGFIGFSMILLVNYVHHRDWITSLLFALTLAMSVIPEEIPVAFTSFMALGAYKMSRLGIISRQPQVIEQLGAVSVICLDKTGTITENKMEVKEIYDGRTDELLPLADAGPGLKNNNVIYYAVLASERDPFDEMEKAIWTAHYLHTADMQVEQLTMVFEFPLEAAIPMMTHVYKHANLTVAAAKGAPETITRVCNMDKYSLEKINGHVDALASNGYRVIGVASAVLPGSEIPASQEGFNWKFEGLLALYDPPKANIASVINQFYDANISLKLVSGDLQETTINIAGQVGIANHRNSITGKEVMEMHPEALAAAVKSINVFARMFPDAKLKVIEALKGNGEIVVMAGDGVNDGPALKSADIGIAMGQKGTGIARQAADLILTDDSFEKILIAITEGRKIFSNLKKAVHYIIAIHIPIILVATVPVVFGWVYPNIFSPIHIIFMELIMGPTCSIFFEREPVEDDVMKRHPRPKTAGLFTSKELFIGIVQGLVIALGALSLYHYYMNHGATIQQTRSIVFSTLILSNVFLTFANRSLTRTMNYTIRFKNNLAAFIVIISATFLLALYFIPFVRELFQLQSISLLRFLTCLATAAACVFWFEVYKLGVVFFKGG